MFLAIFFASPILTFSGGVVRVLAIAIYLFCSIFMIKNIMMKNITVVIKLYILTLIAIIILQFILVNFAEPMVA